MSEVRYKFFRTARGVTSYAEVGLRICDQGDGVRWPDHLKVMRQIHGAAVEAGILDTLRRHAELGGRSHGFEILHIGESVVDTRADAMRCAATAAAWQALDRSAQQITFIHDEVWRASFSCCS